jgi:hypothetical protein
LRAGLGLGVFALLLLSSSDSAAFSAFFAFLGLGLLLAEDFFDFLALGL